MVKRWHRKSEMFANSEVIVNLIIHPIKELAQKLETLSLFSLEQKMKSVHILFFPSVT